MTTNKPFIVPKTVILLLLIPFLSLFAAEKKQESMDKMWGDDDTRQTGIEFSEKAALFRDGNYGMFIHWGLYSHLGGDWNGKTYYGIGEWIMNPRMAGIPAEEYQQIAKEFNPVDFDAKEIARVAKEAGMKWIIITSKHHEGFAMFDSEHPFNIVDATPFGRDPMGELAEACREYELGFGFYYSHFQDWTAPGGHRGPEKNADGTDSSFEQYFREKCFPQVKEICTKYGELAYVWFDTPGSMPKELVVELADYVREAQPNAMLCSRVGHGMGDYRSKGDMDVPVRNAEGLWETCDTTNDSWSYAWYDQNWKDSKEILNRLVATVGRGGTYLLNVGPDGRGRVPAQAAKYLIEAGDWVKKYPEVVYGAGASPWGHRLPWGDVTTTDDGKTLNLVVFDWPESSTLFLPGIDGKIKSAKLLSDGKTSKLKAKSKGSWVQIQLPVKPADFPASVIKLTFNEAPVVDQTFGVYPEDESKLLVEFAEVENATKKEKKWMEKFGEWKHVTQVSDWKDKGTASWTADVKTAGDYYLSLSYSGESRLTWRIETDEGAMLQNNQNASHNYQSFPMGIITFEKPGKHTLSVGLVDGDPKTSSLLSLSLNPAK